MRNAIKIIALLFISLNLQAQNWQKINELDYDAEFYFLTMQYGQALDYYLQIYDLIPDNPSLNYKIGVSYLNMDGEKFKAIQYLELAAENVSDDFKDLSYKDPYAPNISLLFLGNAYRIANSFDQAIEAFTKYGAALDPTDEYGQKLVNQSIRSCNNAKEMLALPKSVKWTNIGGQVNNNMQNINAVVSGDGETLIYTTISKRGYEIYYAKKDGEEWGVSKKISNRLGNHNFFKTAAVSFYGDEIYLLYNDPYNMDIYVSNFIDRQWTKAKKLKKPINSKDKETHVSLSQDGKTMYFTSDRKGGFGELDIYKVTRNEKGKWGEPENMGSDVNTIFNEETPFLTNDEELLFFSSEGHEGMGGYDIFYVDLTSSELQARNIGSPINTTDNDLFFMPFNGGESGMMSINANDSYGLKDIYQVYITKEVLLKGNLSFENTAPNEQSDFNIDIINLEDNQLITSLDGSAQNSSFQINLVPGDYNIAFSGNNIQALNKQINIPQDYSSSEFPLNATIAFNIIQIEELAVNDTSAGEILAENITDDQTRADSLNNSSVQPETLVVENTEEEVAEEETIPENNVTESIPENEVQIEEQTDVVVAEEINQPTEEIKKEVTTTPAVKIETSPMPKASYSIQIMALENPVDASYFANISDIIINKGNDEMYRYSYGETNDIEEAKIQLQEVKDLGYKDAFIRKNKAVSVYTIQLIALKKPIDKTYFKNISDITVFEGEDNLYRYTTGSFNTIKEAQELLTKIQALGHSQAFIKKLN